LQLHKHVSIVIICIKLFLHQRDIYIVSPQTFRLFIIAK
jgi:hypothetical protein